MGTLPPFVYIALALAALAIAGGLLIWVVGYIGGKSRGGPKEREKPPSATVPTEPEAPVPAGEQELLRVSRTKKGRLVVFVQGRRCRHLREITDPQVGRETVEALKAVLAFAEGWLPSARQRTSQPAPRKSTIDEQAFLEQLSQSNLFSLEKPSGPLGRPKRRVSSRSLKPLLPPADEIDNLVQQRLRKWPDLVEDNIRLTTGEDGSLRIHVGLQTFNTVGDIPDPKVRALIRDAIREWETS